MSQNGLVCFVLFWFGGLVWFGELGLIYTAYVSRSYYHEMSACRNRVATQFSETTRFPGIPAPQASVLAPLPRRGWCSPDGIGSHVTKENSGDYPTGCVLPPEPYKRLGLLQVPQIADPRGALWRLVLCCDFEGQTRPRFLTYGLRPVSQWGCLWAPTRK